MNLEGQQFGEFTILERIGQGGMGAVYKASQPSLDRLVALKTLQASLAEDAEYIARFRQEARAAARLSHSNLVQVYSAGETAGLHWFAMEYVEGESAKVRLKRDGRLDPQEAIAIITHVATALDYGWKKAQLIHRDVKPDNIFLSTDGEVKLGDLGLAKSSGQTLELTATGRMLGTPHYISPEQVQGLKTVDFRTDIYSLGCTLYPFLSGRAPYEGNTAVTIMMKHISDPVPDLQEAWPQCPVELAAVVRHMMLKPPEARPQSYGEVIAGLRRAYHQLSGWNVPQAVAETPPQPTPAAAPRDGVKDARPSPREKGGSPAKTLVKGDRPAKREGSPRAIGLAKPKDVRPAKPIGKNRRKLYAEIALALGALLFYLLASKLGVDSAMPPHLLKAPAESFLAGVTREAPFVNSLGMQFVPVPISGGPTARQRVLFSIWDTRVQDYAKYAAANPQVNSDWKTNTTISDIPVGRESDHPVVNVTWDDAQAFCQWLTQKEQAEGRLPKGVAYRLPTDEEWSWAVGLPPEVGATPAEKSGRDDVDFPWGKDFPPTKKVGNYADESLHTVLSGKVDSKDRFVAGYTDGYATTSPVGAFPANAYGLYDMGGNVFQLCDDWLDTSHKDRVLRGASWDNHGSYYLLSSFRGRAAPGLRNYYNGFRCVVGASAH